MIINGQDFIEWLQDLPEDVKQGFKPGFTDDEIEIFAVATEILVSVYYNLYSHPRQEIEFLVREALKK